MLAGMIPGQVPVPQRIVPGSVVDEVGGRADREPGVFQVNDRVRWRGRYSYVYKVYRVWTDEGMVELGPECGRCGGHFKVGAADVDHV